MCPGNNGSNGRGRCPRRPVRNAAFSLRGRVVEDADPYGLFLRVKNAPIKTPRQTGGALASVQNLSVGATRGRPPPQRGGLFAAAARQPGEQGSPLRWFVYFVGAGVRRTRRGHAARPTVRHQTIRCHNPVGAIHESPAAIAPPSSSVIRATHISIASSLESADVR